MKELCRRLVALFLVVAYTARADGPLGGYVAKKTELVLSDGGVYVLEPRDERSVTGCWLDENTCIERARERVEMQERVRLAETKAMAATPKDLTVPVVIALVSGLLVGGLVGASVCMLLRPTQPSH